MKKILIVIALAMVIVISGKEKNIVIPDSAIRFRVVANSNSLEDQRNKNKVSVEVENYLMDLTKTAEDGKEAGEILFHNYEKIKSHVKEYLKEEKIDEQVEVQIGRNYFPKKTYKGIEYPEGYYNSVVLNMGHKQGVNWWCVIYPPLCLLDQENTEEIEYTSLVQEVLKHYSV